jgi:hypothetical protein
VQKSFIFAPGLLSLRKLYRKKEQKEKEGSWVVSEKLVKEKRLVKEIVKTATRISI